jgi:6-phosphogluconolactonase
MKNISRLIIASIVATGISSALIGSTLRLYVAVSGENRIAVYREIGDEGKIVFESDIEVDGGPTSLTVSKDNRFLFSSQSDSGKISSFKIDDKNGSLRLLSETVAGSHASFLHLDQSERFLISSYYFEGHVMVHKVADGHLGNVPRQTIETADRPHSVEVDASNRFVFVPHTAANGIFQFYFDSKTGMATANDVPVLKREGVAGPRHFRLDSKGKYGYGSDEQGNSVTAYRLDSENGRLETLQTLSTLPQKFDGTNSTSDVGIHPSGRYVYVANRGHDSLAAFLVDSDTGQLSLIDRFPCEAATRSFGFSSDGQFLYSAGSGSGKFAVYSVDEGSGALVCIQTLEIGKGPWAIVCVESN